MADGGGLLHLWNEWGIQIMVLLSFALQVLLLACGGTRRHSSSTIKSTVLRIILWLAYQGADSTAIYTLGHLSIASSKSSEHLLVAFWAPFLLLHLGGPDNITAYALEDNRLWLRHLQTLTVQALGAAYVVYRFIFSARSHDGTLLLLAASSMFAAGLAKYGERVWALRCGNISNISSSFDKSDGNVRDLEPLNNWLPMDGGEIGNEEILLRAHSHFDICKGAFTDATMKVHGSSSGSESSTDESSTDDAEPSKSMILNLYKLVEMELSLMYDILYTKAAVIHTWYGFCIHWISLLGAVATFLLFQLSIGSRRDGYNPVDVVISYVLLAGALVLEAMSVCKAILSSWTCSFLYSIGLQRLHAITYLRWRGRWPAKRRLWSGSIGQYNLLDMSVSDRNGITFWLAKKLGLQHWWNELCFSDTFLGNKFCSVEDLKVMVWKEMLKMGTKVNSRGSSALQDNSCDKYKWSVDDNMDLDSSILVWHIVTDLVIRLPRNEEKVDKRLAEVTKVLSNYMMFLLVVKPDMLPSHTRRNLYLNACKELNRYWSDCSKEWGQLEKIESWRQVDMLANWLLGDLYHKLEKNGSSPVEIKLWKNDPSSDKTDIESRAEEELPEYAKDVYNAIWIFESLWSKPCDEVRLLEIIFQVWIEMIMYVAEHCSRDSHARQLSDGGEFITIMWLMVHHLRVHYHVAYGAPP